MSTGSSAAPRPSDKDAISSAPYGPGSSVLLTARQYDDADRNGALVEETSAFRSDIELFYDWHTLIWNAESGRTLDVRDDAVSSEIAYATPRVPEIQLVNRFDLATGSAVVGTELLPSVERSAVLARNRARFDSDAERTLYTLLDLGIHDHDHDDPNVVHEATVTSVDGTDYVVAHDDGRHLALAQRFGQRRGFDGARVGHVTSLGGADRSAWADIYLESDGHLESNRHATGNLDVGIGLHVDDESTVEWLTAIGFGRDRETAMQNADHVLDAEYPTERTTFAEAWEDWHADLHPAPADDPGIVNRYEASLTSLKCAQDGDHDAIIAGAFKPAGMTYKFVWPRDLVSTIAALVTAGAYDDADRALSWLDRTQVEEATDERGIDREGSWWQNYYTTGQPHWHQLQLDQVGGPIYAHWLVWQSATDRQIDAGAVRDRHYGTSRAAAEFLLGYDAGDWPRKHWDPWEEVRGYTTEGTAAAIAGLRCMAELATDRGEERFAARCRRRAATWADGFTEAFVRETEYGRHFVTALDPEPHSGPPADARPDAAAFMACWPWNVVDADSRALHDTLEVARHADWNAPDAACLDRYPGDRYTPSGRPEDGGWPICEAYADVARWMSDRDPDAIHDHLVDAHWWTTAAGLLPERVDGNGQPRWNANLSWSQATYVALAVIEAEVELVGLAPGVNDPGT